MKFQVLRFVSLVLYINRVLHFMTLTVANIM